MICLKAGQKFCCKVICFKLSSGMSSTSRSPVLRGPRKSWISSTSLGFLGMTRRCAQMLPTVCPYLSMGTTQKAQQNISHFCKLGRCQKNKNRNNIKNKTYLSKIYRFKCMASSALKNGISKAAPFTTTACQEQFADLMAKHVQ